MQKQFKTTKAKILWKLSDLIDQYETDLINNGFEKQFTYLLCSEKEERLYPSNQLDNTVQLEVSFYDLNDSVLDRIILKYEYIVPLNKSQNSTKKIYLTISDKTQEFDVMYLNEEQILNKIDECIKSLDPIFEYHFIYLTNSPRKYSEEEELLAYHDRLMDERRDMEYANE